jgi:hypothetical protein
MAMESDMPQRPSTFSRNKKNIDTYTIDPGIW